MQGVHHRFPAQLTLCVHFGRSERGSPITSDCRYISCGPTFEVSFPGLACIIHAVTLTLQAWAHRTGLGFRQIAQKCCPSRDSRIRFS